MSEKLIREGFRVTDEDKKNATHSIVRNIDDYEQAKFALNLLNSIENKLVLNEFVKVACNPNLLKSKYYKRVLSLILDGKNVKPMMYIGKITCNDAFLKSEHCEFAIELLEKSTPYNEYCVFFQLINSIDKGLNLEELHELKEYMEVLEEKKKLEKVRK